MRPQKIEESELLTGLMTVLRTKGYDGASLNELADFSGLKKASLYHRYPGGKKDIALSVLKFVGEWIDKNIIDVIDNRSLTPQERLQTTLNNIDILYSSGKSSCILRALSTDSGMELFGDELKNSVKRWLSCFSRIGVDFGYDKATSEQKAMQVLVKIQGSLVVSKTLESTRPFIDALDEIRLLYIKD